LVLALAGVSAAFRHRSGQRWWRDRTYPRSRPRLERSQPVG
jgi:hypothetical protein